MLGSKYPPKLFRFAMQTKARGERPAKLKSAACVGAGVATKISGAVRSTGAVSGLDRADGRTYAHASCCRNSPRRCGACARQIPIIISGVFDGGFLVGSIVWTAGLLARRIGGSIVAHVANCVCGALSWDGILRPRPVSICTLGAGVVAVLLNSQHPDRVRRMRLCTRLVPDLFWHR